MTKKSASRLASDANKRNEQARKAAFTKSNTAWSDLTAIYRESQSRLNLIVATVQGFFGTEDIHRFIPAEQAAYTVQAISGLGKDVQAFQIRLNGIFAQHKDRTGMYVQDENKPGDYVLLISVGDQYTQFEHDYNTILDPLHKQVLALMQSVEKRVADVAEAAEQAASGAVETTLV